MLLVIPNAGIKENHWTVFRVCSEIRNTVNMNYKSTKQANLYQKTNTSRKTLQLISCSDDENKVIPTECWAFDKTFSLDWLFSTCLSFTDFLRGDGQWGWGQPPAVGWYSVPPWAGATAGPGCPGASGRSWCFGASWGHVSITQRQHSELVSDWALQLQKTLKGIRMSFRTYTLFSSVLYTLTLQCMFYIK